MSEVLRAAGRGVAAARASWRASGASSRETRAQLEKERARLGTSYREELERLRDDVTRQVANEIKHLRELDRGARANVNAAEIVQDA